MSDDQSIRQAADEAVTADAVVTKGEAVTGAAADGTVTPSPQAETEAVPQAQSVAATTPAATDSPTAADAAFSATGKPMPESHSISSVPAPAAPVVIKQSSGKGVALGALVLSLLALGASGFLFVQGQNVLKTQELGLAQKIDAAGLGQSKNAALLESSSTRMAALDEQVRALQAQNQQFGSQLTTTSRAYQELVKSRSNWVVDETEATLNLAAQQLLISGNVLVAVAVLENLENRLSRFDQPQLLPIKQAVSQDLAALKNKPYLDVAGASLRLNRLETAVASLPLMADSTLQPGVDKAVPLAADANASWWQRSWQKMVQSLKGMVEVRHVNNNDSMLLAPDQVYFIRENLRLRLMDARLALMQRSSEVYIGDLNTAEAAVKQYFDTQSATTQSWLQELVQLKGLDVQNVQDGNMLATSLSAVRQYQQQVHADARLPLPDVSASVPAIASEASATPASPAAASAAQQGGHTL